MKIKSELSDRIYYECGLCKGTGRENTSMGETGCDTCDGTGSIMKRKKIEDVKPNGVKIMSDIHKGFIEALGNYPSQDNEGWIPERGSFKAGFYEGYRYCEKSKSVMEEEIKKLKTQLEEANKLILSAKQTFAKNTTNSEADDYIAKYLTPKEQDHVKQ